MATVCAVSASSTLSVFGRSAGAHCLDGRDEQVQGHTMRNGHVTPKYLKGMVGATGIEPVTPPV